MKDIFFKSAHHKERFVMTMQRIGKIDDRKFDPEYAAAVYILTADLSTWDRVEDDVSRHGILFEEILQQHWSEGYRVLIQWAANLFNEYVAHIDPVELMRLDTGNFSVAVTSLMVRRNGYHLAEE